MTGNDDPAYRVEGPRLRLSKGFSSSTAKASFSRQRMVNQRDQAKTIGLILD